MKNKASGRIRNLLRLRKQNDTVKIICILSLAAMAFLIRTVQQIWGIYQYAAAPAEYIVTAEGAMSGKRVDELLQNKEVARVSRQMKLPVSVLFKGREAVVDCSVLSQEYMQEITGMETASGSSRIYMNEAAYADLQEMVSEGEGTIPEESGQGLAEKGREMDIRYSTGEDPEAGDVTGQTEALPNYYWAKLVVYKAGGEEPESFIYTAETDRRLQREAAGLRVQFKNHDLDGIHVENLKKLGYEIENQETVSEEEWELQIKLLHIRYGLLVCGLCVLCGWLLGKYAY